MMLSGVQKHIMKLFLLLNCICIYKPRTQHHGYGAVGSTIKVCPLGYTGLNCFFTCRYPSFGHFCQNRCNCNQPNCDHKTGCKGGSPTITIPDHIMKTVKTSIQKRETTNGCPIGYIGPNCNVTCRFPSFGLKCQQECNCTEQLCNYKEGCRENLTTYKMDTSTIYTIIYTQDRLDTRTQGKNIENTFPSHEDIMTKSNDTNGLFSLQTVIVVLSIFASILICVYVSTFAMTPRSQGIENNVVLEIHRNSEQV